MDGCNCGNCKWYWTGKCNNKDFQAMVSGSSCEDEFIELTENGVLSEYIRENDYKAYELADIVLERLSDLEYIKKSKKKILTYKNIDNNEDFLNNFTEIVDDIISGFVLKKIKDVEMDYEVDYEFRCKFWE